MTSNLEQLSDRLARAMEAGEPLSVFVPLTRLLARGQPVTTSELAQATGRPAGEVAQAVTAMPDIELDEQQRIVGYGLTLRPTQHRFETGGRQLYTWCALDTLIIPRLLGQTARVESPCHATGSPVRLTAGPDGVTGAEPATAVVSVVTPEQPRSVREAFCANVHFFASAEAAGPWLAAHPGASVVSVADAYELGRRLADRTGRGERGCC
jgi:alkylmercury lyase